MTTTRTELMAALSSLPKWTMADGERDTVFADTKVIHVYLPLTSVGYWLAEREDFSFVDSMHREVEDSRYFGMCDLGLGFPELGWVDEDTLLSVHTITIGEGQFKVPIQVEFEVSPREWTMAEAYEAVGKDPSVLPHREGEHVDR